VRRARTFCNTLVPSVLLPKRRGPQILRHVLVGGERRCSVRRTRCSFNELQAYTIAPSQVGCETATKTGMVMVFGEITTSAKVDYEAIVRKTCRDIGFTSAEVGLDADKCKVPSSL